MHSDVDRRRQLRFTCVNTSVAPRHLCHHQTRREVLSVHQQVLVVIDHGAIMVPEYVYRGRGREMHLAL